MKFRIDLHVHSRYSEDTDADPEESVRRAIGLGLDGIVFTEHYSYEASEPVEALREKYRGTIRIFRGVEFSSAEGHVLVFGVNTDALLQKYAPVLEVIRIVNQAGGVVIPSHPYRKGTSLGDMIWGLRGLCALEGHNGGNMLAYNAKAIESAQALNLPYTGGSDAHHPQDVGLCFTEFDDVVSEESFIPLLKAGNYRGIDNRRRSPLTGRE